eukprot:g2090.t1
MKLFSFVSKLTLEKHVGVVVPGQTNEICDLSEALSTKESLKEFLGGGEAHMAERVNAALSSGKGRKLMSSLDIVAPISDPGKILCVGMNYREHCIEQDVPIPEEPTLFSKFNNTVTKYNGDVVFDSRLTQEMDWEVEMVIVIGKEGKNIKKENAMDYVAGYSVSHDVSARDWQMKKNGGQWLLGKSMDTFFPYGPYIVTKDEQIDPHNLGIRCYVNDKLVQNSNTNELVFKTEELVEYISKFVTLLPGDLISTGTPSGVGCFRNPPVFLKHGDRVRCEIDHLGVVENNMVDIGRSSL